MAEIESEYVKVHTLSDRFEADFIEGALKQEGIPVIVRQFMETPYSGIFIPQKGWGRIMVPKEMADLAREIISGLMENEEGGDAPTPGNRQIEPRLRDALEQVSQPAEQLKTGTRIEPRLWDTLRRAAPLEITTRVLAEFDGEKNAYIVPFLNTAVLCYPETEEIEVLGSLEEFSKDFQLNLVVLHYLLYARGVPPADKWVSEKDLPGGGLFFTAAHALPLESLAGAFDAGPGLLDAATQSIGGEKAGVGGQSYRFRIFPRIPILLIFWARDEEFEPSFHILFDETIIDHLGSLDLIWALVNVFVRVLLDTAARVPESD